jgi:hypothetical protein
MANASDNYSAAEIEREINDNRRRIEERIEAIQERMSPGQLVDEVIAYAKQGTVADYVASLGNAAKANPLPLALMGISLAWLMVSPAVARKSGGSSEEMGDEPEELPFATVSGAMWRESTVEEDGQRYSYFSDRSGGGRFKALTNEAGHRAGNFIDESGKIYGGFVDAMGRHVTDIRNEAGVLLDEASGWLSNTWRQIGNSASSVQGALSDTGRKMRQGSVSAGQSLRRETARLNDTLVRQFRDQPLVGGALAFAAGAAIGASLPRTEQEDEMIGETGDKIRRQISNSVSETASDVLDQTEQTAANVYQRAAAEASANADADGGRPVGGA